MLGGSMPAELKPVPYNALSEPVRLDLMRQIGDHSVALARMTGNDTGSFELLGSGTLVRRGREHGVLTAAHVLHRNKRPVQLGVVGADRIILIAKLNRIAEVATVDLEELLLGWHEGDDDEYGPDLTFIRFRTEALRSAVAAVCSFWSLERDPEELIETFGVDRACVITTGYPRIKQDITVTPTKVHINAMLWGGTSGLLQEDIEQRGEWDFIRLPFDYRRFPNLPENLGGMSGGGIWSALFRSDENGVLQIHRFDLVGVCYWHAPSGTEAPLGRGHFIRSIYGRAWPLFS